jgi:hypothetical protein
MFTVLKFYVLYWFISWYHKTKKQVCNLCSHHVVLHFFINIPGINNDLRTSVVPTSVMEHIIGTSLEGGAE